LKRPRNDNLLAAYHDLANRVSPKLQAELDGLRAAIVDGTVTVDSPSTPK
jgi:basic membrane protein A